MTRALFSCFLRDRDVFAVFSVTFLMREYALNHDFLNKWICASLLKQLQQRRLVPCKQLASPRFKGHEGGALVELTIFFCRLQQALDSILFRDSQLQILVCTELLELSRGHFLQSQTFFRFHLAALRVVGGDRLTNIRFVRKESVHHLLVLLVT